MLETLSRVDATRVRDLLLERMQGDPVGYRREMLAVQSTPQQDEVAESVRDNLKTLVQAAHGVGKTHLTAGLVQWFHDCFRPSITLTTAPSWNSVVELLWAEVSNQRRSSPRLDTSELCAFWGGTPTALRTSELHYAKGHNARTGEGFQGRHDERLFIAIDEGPGVPEHIWKAADSMLQSDLTRLLAIGNPTVTSGPYYDARSDPSFHVIRMSALDHPNIALELLGLPPLIPKAVRLSWVTNMIEKHCMPMQGEAPDLFEFPPGSGIWYRPNDEFRSRALGLFPKQATNAIWDEAVIDYCRENRLPEPDEMPQLGCDVARFGDDNTTLYGRRGPVVLFGERHSQRSTVFVSGLCIRRAKELGETYGIDARTIPIKVDDSGVGGGVTDQIFAEGFNVVPVNSANTAIESEKYPNRRSELWFVVRDRATDKSLGLDLSRLDKDSFTWLKRDLLTPTYRLDGQGRRVVEAKDATKTRLKRAPDDADGFNLAFYSQYAHVAVAPGGTTQKSAWQ